MFTENDKSIVRELAREYLSLFYKHDHEEMTKRFRDTNDRKLVRPPLLINEIPWHQMNIDDELTCICENDTARGIEADLRRRIFYLKHFKGADHTYSPYLKLVKAFDATDIGVVRKVDDVRRADAKNHIASSHFEDVFEDESALEKMHDPIFTPRPDLDEKRMEAYLELVGDSIPVKLCGIPFVAFVPWDDLAFLRGVEPIFMDMYDRPEYLHAIMEKLCSAANARIAFIEKYVGFDRDHPDLHCTPSAISGLESQGLKSVWFRGTAQALGSVSPQMFDEFEVEYIKPIAERFAYTYYGCCEPLDDRIEKIKRIGNLRKIGCSPWANVERCAEQIGGDFVLSRKPNPANVAVATDPEVIRREIEETAKACIKYGCPCDIVLKDISTVSYRPENLILWAETASRVLDEYY